MNVLARWTFLAAVLLLTACQGAHWKHFAEPGTRLTGPRGCALEVPADWTVFQTGEAVLLTRDGPPVQQIAVLYFDEFHKSQRKVDPAAAPAELAELFVAEWKSLPNAGEVTVLENSPARVAGRDGFRLRFRNNLHQQRLPIDEYLVHGVAHGTGLYVISYGAWAGHAFERDLSACESVVESFELPQ